MRYKLSSDLLVHVRQSLDSLPQGRPRQAVYRRAISSCYYAVFHRILEDVTAMLVPGLAALPEVQAHFYRAIGHNDVATVCRLFVQQSQDPARVRWDPPYSWLTGVSISADLKDVCEKFTELQKDRHEADYNPNGGYTKTQALLALNKADVWLTKWDTVAADPTQTAALTAFLYLLGPDKVVARS